MKFKQYLSIMVDDRGFFPIPKFRWVLNKNTRKTAREEAIAASVLQQANPRENISKSHPWGPEEQWILQQAWIHPETLEVELRPVPFNDKHLYTTAETEHGPLPIPNAIKEPEILPMDLHEKLRELFDLD